MRRLVRFGERLLRGEVPGAESLGDGLRAGLEGVMSPLAEELEAFERERGLDLPGGER